MSIRYTAMFVGAPVAPDTITFSTKAVQITGVGFSLGPVTITFNTKAVQVAGIAFSIPDRIQFSTKALEITPNTFTVIKGHINHDNMFMAF